jgi:rSAM/selenodomain-associated transferase 2
MKSLAGEMRFSVVIPVLNEESTLGNCLNRVRAESQDVEIIVSDGGSDDATVAVALAHGARIVSGLRGRGTQLNTGAAESGGEVLVFLHADTIIPRGSLRFLAEQFRDPTLQCGAFRAAYDDSSLVLRLYSWFTRFESGFTTFGDQCLVVRRSFFGAMGGFPAWPLFEDMEFLKRARLRTTIRKFPLRVVTSARKFREGGEILQQLRNVFAITLYHFGVSPWLLYRRYYGKEVDELDRVSGDAILQESPEQMRAGENGQC